MEQVALGQGLVTQVVFENNIIAVSQSTGLMYIIDYDDKKQKVLQNDKGVWALALSDTYLASGDTAGHLRTWDITTGYDIAFIMTQN